MANISKESFQGKQQPQVVSAQSISGLARKLIQMGKLDETKALDLLEKAKQNQIPLVSCLIEEKIISAAEIASISSEAFGIPIFDLKTINLEYLPKALLNEKLIREYHGLPIYKRGNRLYVAISDPTNVAAIDEFRFSTGLSVEAILVEDPVLQACIESVLSSSEAQSFSGLDDTDLDSLDISSTDNDGLKPESLMGTSEADDAPIVRFVNKILLDAINKGASDIHFEPYEKNYRIRYRQDGILSEISTPPVNIGSRLCARLKVMSKLDISERRIPQDGRFKMTISKNRSIDFRVSTCPTLFGEKVVMRILDPANAKLGIDALGYEEKQKEDFLYAIHRPQGMVLVTGPTGSGKTISLYTALNILNTNQVNISTAEDPVEINLPGINQVNVNPKAGLSFSAALKSFLRQDPDIVMVGEIRDLETAEIAVKAAQTGHMVLSTLHTNSAPETIMRLMNMGIQPFNLATSVILVVAQRLARRLCQNCKENITVPKEALLQSGFLETELSEFKLYGPKGCEQCNQGYKGRVGLYEVLPISKEMGKIIMQNGSAIDIANQMDKEGYITLRRAGLNKVKLGSTSLEEINRVTKD
jgi:type IV pilus assembly protein PilB